MSMQDPIADMLTRIRNACLARHEAVSIPASRHKEDILRVLVEEGYLASFERKPAGARDLLVARIAYTPGDNRPVIQGLKRVSTPGRRTYCGVTELPKVLSGLGHAVLSTSRGVMTGQRARRLGVGGEVIFAVW